MKPAPAPTVVAWVHRCDAADLYTTSITLAEIVYGIERLPGGRREAQFKATAEEVASIDRWNDLRSMAAAPRFATR